MMRFLIDMNLSPEWVAFMRSAGFQAVHWSEVGEADALDWSLMEWAANHDHVVVTNDLDFSAILAATRRRKPSVVQIRSSQRSPTLIGTLVVRAVLQMELDLANGALVSIDTKRTRVRILPLRS